MKRILDMLFNNLGWKIISLIFAISIWFIGMNINDPSTNYTLKVNLTIDNKDKVKSNGFVILNQEDLEKQQISMVIRTTRSKWEMLDRSKVKAYIDINLIDLTYEKKLGERQPISINYGLPYNVSSSDYQVTLAPYSTNIIMDKLVSSTEPVIVDKKGADANEGYVSSSPIVEPEKISVSGASSIISTIDSVRVELDIKDATEDVTTLLKPQVYDKYDKNITNQLTLEPPEISVTVPINMYTKVPLNIKYTGNLADGYTLVSVDKNISYVELVGTKEDITAIKSIDLAPANLEGLSDTKTFTYDLRKYITNPNISIKNGTPNEAKITVVIEKEVIKEFEIPVENLTIKGMNANVQIARAVPITVKGIEKDISALTIDNISGTLDLTNYSKPGTYQVPVSFSLPEGVQQYNNNSKIEVTILEPIIKETEETPKQTEAITNTDTISE